MTRILPVLLTILAVLGCSRDEATLEPSPPCPAITGISVSPASANLAVGDSVQFTARVIVYRGIPCAAVELDGPFAWSTADSATARVQSSSGLVVARTTGTTVVTVRWVQDRNFAASVQVLVSR
jgi:uncharacterized protein YjdB